MAKRRRFFKLFPIKKSKRKSFTTTLILLVAIGLFSGYALVRQHQASQTPPPQASSGTRLATLYFINEIGEDARSIAQEHDLYASVMIAQAVLESNHGTSKLGSDPNYNLFGIKGDYQGASVTFQTWEDDGKGHPYTIDAQFRKYPSYRQSLEDYADLLSRNLYANAWKSNARSYQEATQALTGLYATDTSYNAKLNQLIQTYHLSDYDSPVNPYKPGQIYNVYRQTYTPISTLEEDNNWAKQQLAAS